MDFHESFWVVAGTAAPVIALGAILTLGDVVRVAEDRQVMIAATLVAKNRAQLAKEFRKASWLGNWAYAIAFINLLMQVFIVALALISLAKHRDVVPLIIVEIMVPIGLMLLLAGTILAAAERARHRVITTPPQPPGPAS